MAVLLPPGEGLGYVTFDVLSSVLGELKPVSEEPFNVHELLPPIEELGLGIQVFIVVLEPPHCLEHELVLLAAPLLQSMGHVLVAIPLLLQLLLRRVVLPPLEVDPDLVADVVQHCE